MRWPSVRSLHPPPCTGPARERRRPSLFHGRQSARTLHFVLAASLVALSPCISGTPWSWGKALRRTVQRSSSTRSVPLSPISVQREQERAPKVQVKRIGPQRAFRENGVFVKDWRRLEGNWKQMKGKVKEQWGKLIDDDLTRRRLPQPFSGRQGDHRHELERTPLLRAESGHDPLETAVPFPDHHAARRDRCLVARSGRSGGASQVGAASMCCAAPCSPNSVGSIR